MKARKLSVHGASALLAVFAVVFTASMGIMVISVLDDWKLSVGQACWFIGGLAVMAFGSLAGAFWMMNLKADLKDRMKLGIG